jgi:hypothetical protein
MADDRKAQMAAGVTRVNLPSIPVDIRPRIFSDLGRRNVRRIFCLAKLLNKMYLS